MKLLMYSFAVWLLMFILPGCVSNTGDENEIKVTGEKVNERGCLKARLLNPEEPC